MGEWIAITFVAAFLWWMICRALAWAAGMIVAAAIVIMRK